MQDMIYLFLAPGFEEVEAMTPLDILRRAGLAVTTVAITTPAGIPATETAVTGAHGITVLADMSEAALLSLLDASASCDSPDVCPVGASLLGVILPGGMPGTKHLDASPIVDRMLALAADRGATMAAICAAPSVLGKRGYLQGKRATCFPGFEEDLKGAEVGGFVVRDGQVVTAAGMGVAAEFGYELVAGFASPEVAAQIRRAVRTP